LDNFIIHYEETGPEIYEALNGKIDYFVNGSGTGGTIAGISQYLKERNQGIQVILADPEGSALSNRVNCGVLFTDEDKEGFRKKIIQDTVVEGVGLNRLTRNFEQAYIDKVFD